MKCQKQPVPIKQKTRESEKAEKIVKRTFRELKSTFYDLDYSLSLLKPMAVESSEEPGCDGEHFFYSPNWILTNWGTFTGRHKVKASILHIVLHGLMGHFSEHSKYSKEKVIFDVMDVQVDRILERLGEEYNRMNDEDAEELAAIKSMHDYGLYFAALKSKKLRLGLRRIVKHTKKDIHDYWPVVKIEDEKSNSEGDGQSIGDKAGKAAHSQRVRLTVMKWEEARKLLVKGALSPEDLSKQIASILISDLHSTKYGNRGANGIITAAADKKCNPKSYMEMLKNFIDIKEMDKEEDNIDPMLYEYGLSIYDDMPLVEPAEINDQLKLDSIVLAIDTSGSCAGEAGRFLSETNQILTDIERIGRLGKIHLLQCDAQIQDEECLESVDNLKKYETKEFYGFGGTDFIPVFMRAKEYRNHGEKVDLLIYFSDGFGSFPEESPGYPVWFVIPKEYYSYYEEHRDALPDWVEKMVLD